MYSTVGATHTWATHTLCQCGTYTDRYKWFTSFNYYTHRHSTQIMNCTTRWESESVIATLSNLEFLGLHCSVESEFHCKTIPIKAQNESKLCLSGSVCVCALPSIDHISIYAMPHTHVMAPAYIGAQLIDLLLLSVCGVPSLPMATDCN